ncbi:MAG: DNA repair protein RadA [Helicobacteraceae bacterium]|jgi:DNA repair protein RadA/Sms|nr:DNA repair protein RadA [Helicobacteraceae bacterium]
MAKAKSFFECQHCGMTTPRWTGKCSNCGAWDSLIEIKEKIEPKNLRAANGSKNVKSAVAITEVEEDNFLRFSTREAELDRALGGGLVSGSLVLIGGSPGVGKSTLLLKIAANLAESGRKVLYVSAEESAGQIRLRADRIGALKPKLMLLNEISLETIKEELKNDYEAAVIDSIQTLYSEALSAAPGSVSQVREITFELMRIAKEQNIAIFIIGHITKDGSIAGPRVLEHMVDTVLYFEGDSSEELRILRAFKNRYGSASEIGIFEMTREGLKSAGNVGGRFFTRRENKCGSAATIVMEGSRPLVLEVQALVSDAFGNPRRSSTGFDQTRLTMLLALLEKKLELPFNRYDVFINIAGGIRVNETAADLAVIAAILSSFRNRPIGEKTLFIGEVSLIGDIREVSSMDQRLTEGVSQGFEKAVVPRKPLSKIDIKCFVAEEVAKVIDWM